MADHQAGLFQLWTQLPDLCGLCDEHLFRDHDSRLADLPQPGQKTHQKDFFSPHCLTCPFLDSAFGGKSQCLRLWVPEQPRPVLGSDVCENLLPLASLLLLFLRVVCTVQSLASPRQVCLPIGQLSCSSQKSPSKDSPVGSGRDPDHFRFPGSVAKRVRQRILQWGLGGARIISVFPDP